MEVGTLIYTTTKPIKNENYKNRYTIIINHGFNMGINLLIN